MRTLDAAVFAPTIAAMNDSGSRRPWQKLVCWPIATPAAALLVALLVCALAAVGVSRLRPEPSLDGMFANDNPASHALLRVLHHFSAAEEMLLLVSQPAATSESSSPSPEPQRLLAFAERLESAVRASADVSAMCPAMSYRVDPETRRFFEKELVPAGLFYLSNDAVAAARERLTPQGMAQQIARNESLMAVPGPAAQVLAKISLQDPLRLHEFILDRLVGQKPFQTYQNSEAFLSADGRNLLIRLGGARPPSEIEFSKAFTAAITLLAAKVNTDNLDLQFAGAYPIATESERAIRRDMSASITGSVVFLQLLFLLMYRKPLRLFLLAFAPVAMGVLLAFGASSIFQSTLTPITGVIGAILAGLAIDYSVYLISDYEAHRKRGLTPQDAARETVLAVTPALFAAWFTSLIGFVAIGWSSVPAIRDFAWLGSMGLSGAFFCALMLLPATLALVDRRKTTETARRPQMRLRTLPLLMLIARYRWWLVATSVLVLLGSGLVLALSPEGPLPIEQDMTVLHPRPNPALEAQQQIGKRFGTSPDSLLLYLKADSPETLVTLAHAARQRLSNPQVRREGGISGSFGLADLLPDPQVVPKRLDALRSLDAAKVVSDFRAAINASAFDPEAYHGYAEFLQTLLTRQSPPTMTSLLDYPSLARNLLPANAIATHTPPTESIMLVFVKKSLDQQADRRAAIESVRGAVADLPGATLTGISVIAYDTEGIIHRDLPRLIGFAGLAVVLYLLIHFRRVGATCLAILPMAASLLVLLAVARLTDHRLNMVNLIAAPLLIGIDVDYGIFLVSLGVSCAGMTRRQLAERIDSGCYAVLVCAGSALLGFGSLYFTSVPAIQSLGFAVGVGIAASLGFTLLFRLPLLFAAASPEPDPPSRSLP